MPITTLEDALKHYGRALDSAVLAHKDYAEGVLHAHKTGDKKDAGLTLHAMGKYLRDVNALYEDCCKYVGVPSNVK